MIKKAIKAPSFLNEPISYKKAFSRGVRVSLGAFDMLIISGTASLDRRGKTCHVGNVRLQTKRVFNNIKGLLRSEGATWHEVVQTRCYLKDMKQYPEFNEVRTAFYDQHEIGPFPASVCVQADLCRPELLVEIEAMAIVPKLK